MSEQGRGVLPGLARDALRRCSERRRASLLLCCSGCHWPAPRSSRSKRPCNRKQTWLARLLSTLNRQQTRRFLLVEIRCHCPGQILEHASSLLAACRQHRPYPLTETLSLFPSRALGDVPVDHHEADGLFRSVVRRLYPRRG